MECNTNMKAFAKLIFLLFLAAPALSAQDWGLLTDQNVKAYSIGTDDITGSAENSLEYTAAVIPWISVPMENADLFISAAASAHFADKQWEIIPELLRTEISLRLAQNGTLSVGRIGYTDPLGIVANGLFDGIYYSHDSERGTIGAGAWYTGLLFKKTAYITMTEEDLDLYYEGLDYSDFAGTYFAPKRAFGALDWDYSAGDFSALNCALMGQVDLSGREKLYHSIYLMAKLTVPVNSFIFELGGLAETAIASKRYYYSFAGEFGIGWMLPTPIHDKLQLRGRLTNGALPDFNIIPFVPVTTIPQGNVLRTKLSGLSMISLDYTARLHTTFSVQLASSYFILSDLDTYPSNGLIGGTDGFFLGNEFYGRLVWSPVSDLHITAGGGAFLPSMGNADRNAGMIIFAEFTVKLAVF